MFDLVFRMDYEFESISKSAFFRFLKLVNVIEKKLAYLKHGFQEVIFIANSIENFLFQGRHKNCFTSPYQKEARSIKNGGCYSHDLRFNQSILKI